MFKLKPTSSMPFRINLSKVLQSKITTRHIHKPCFVSDEIIMENVLGKFIAIGINLSETKNILTEAALERLSDSIKNFESNSEMHAAILHGCGGNFCNGKVETTAAEDLGHNLLQILQTTKKPIIASLDGFTRDFGLHLAIMCDARVMDKTGLAKVQHVPKKLLPFMYDRLVLTVGPARALELLCTRQTWPATECLTMGLVNKIVDHGCALGQSIVLAQSIAFNNPLETLIEHKSKILSILNRNV